MNQLFWNAYKRLETEVLALSEAIHFDDWQKRVYSARISDLLVRTVIEIEALSKVLFERAGGEGPVGRYLYFDTDCLDLLEKKWRIDCKTVFVSSPYFYFEDEKMKILRPLQKASKYGDKSSEWKQAYQAVKHDRVNNLQQGCIENLLNALAALFILNIYYRDADIENVKDGRASNVDWSLGSDIFTVKISHETEGVSLKQIYIPKADYEESIYLVKHTDKTAQAVIDLLTRLNDEALRSTSDSIAEILNQKVKSGELNAVQNLNEISVLVKGLYDQLGASTLTEVARKNGRLIADAFNGLRFEAVLNKQQY